MEDGVHPRGKFLDAETGGENEHKHDQKDIATGVGVVFKPNSAIKNRLKERGEHE